MEEGYYMPEIEELHAGMEVELKCQVVAENHVAKLKPCNEAEFSKRKLVGRGNWENLEDLIKAECIRIKYLDREDIESMGFEHVSGLLYLAGPNAFEYELWFEGEGSVGIYLRGTGLKFRGIIKNKSELKRILKQVGYEG